MHSYRSLHVMAIDSGTCRPFVTVTIVAGTTAEHTCTAQKNFELEGLQEVRDLIDWSAEAYAQAFDQLTADGWKVTHHKCDHDAGAVVFGA